MQSLITSARKDEEAVGKAFERMDVLCSGWQSRYLYMSVKTYRETSNSTMSYV